MGGEGENTVTREVHGAYPRLGGGSRLFQLCHFLDVPIEFFFEGLEEGLTASSEDDVMVKRETLELVRAYYRNRDPKVRDALRRMAFAMGKRAGGP